MNNMTLTEIAGACNGRLFASDGYHERKAAGVVLDSRKVEKDYLFIAAKGARADGHDFIDTAFDKNALAVVCEKAPLSPKGPYILVDNSFVALKDIAAWYRMQLNVTVVGITGSVGKTSAKEFIGSVLNQKYSVLKTEGNFNNEVGLPLTILKIRDDHNAAVLEMGISHFGEMHRLSEIAKPDIVVVTNIGQSHLENLKSREGVFKAKSEIFDCMNRNGRVCINGDDDMLSAIREVNGIKPVRFGMGTDNDVFAANVVNRGYSGCSCDIHTKGNIFRTNIPLPGEHMVFNAMAAVSVGLLMDLTCEEIAAGIEAVLPLGGRNNIIRLKKWTIIDDCYNASPVSMKAAIDLLSIADTRKVAILGDMYELGDMENSLHNEIGRYAAARNVDVILCVGKLSLNMYYGAAGGYTGILLYYETLNELIQALPSIVNKGDTILVKASHRMEFEKAVKTLIPE